MKAADIIKVIEDFAPASLQESWDNTGLQIGSPEDEISGVMVAFDCIPALVDEAVAAGCNMIVTHHPLLYEGLRHIDPSDPVGQTVIRAVRAGVTVYASHTSSDKVIEGVSGAMARRLGLQGIEPLDEGGFGAIGKWPVPKTASEAIEALKQAFGLKVLRTSKPVEGLIDTVAMCGGSGSSLIETARSRGAQLYICGDITYHHFFLPEGFMVADVGHFESEVEIVDVLYSLLRKNFPTFAVRTCENIRNNNPVFYN